jgi:glucose-6-phosphate isomerase
VQPFSLEDDGMTTLRSAPELATVAARNGLVQLPDEAVEYNFLHAVAPVVEQWTPLAELQQKHLIARSRLQAIWPSLTALRGQVAAEREIVEPKPEQAPLHAGFIDLPQKMLDFHRRRGDASDLGRMLSLAARLREECDRVIVLGAGGAHRGPCALFEALLPTHHNELPPQARIGTPRLYFAGNDFDGDSTQDLLDMLENTCIDPELRDERWGVIVSNRDDHLETATSFRVFRAEAARYYGNHSPRLKRVIVPVAGSKSALHNQFKADGYTEEEILTVPESVGSRFSVFTAAGLLPAAVMGLDVRALLLGAVAATKRFFEEPFERNPALQLAVVNFLLAEDQQKRVRLTAAWSPKLARLCDWYGHLVAESLGKLGRGSMPITAVMPRDLHVLGQLLQDGPRDSMVTNLLVRNPRTPANAIGMADRNEDGLNVIARKTHGDLLTASHQAFCEARLAAARPSADLTLPTLSEHALGQLMQMLMLATVVEARLMGVNPYGELAVKSYKSSFRAVLGLA